MKPAPLPTSTTKLADIIYGNIVAPEPLFQGFLLDKTVTFLTAPPYSGKSLMLAHLALCLDTGTPLFGRFPPLGVRKPLCILQDAPTYDYAEQYRKLVRGMGLGKEVVELLETRLIINEHIQIDDPQFLPWLEHMHEQEQFDVLCMDALWVLHSLDENSGPHAAFITKQFKRARDIFGGAVIVAHHERKLSAIDALGGGARERLRGHSNFSAGIDFHIALHRKGQVLRIELPKARGMKEIVAEVTIEEVDHPGGEALKLVSSAPEQGRLERLVAFLLDTKKRAEIEELYKAAYKMTTAQARRSVDSDLRVLAANNVIQRRSYGVWEVVGGQPEAKRNIPSDSPVAAVRSSHLAPAQPAK